MSGSETIKGNHLGRKSKLKGEEFTKENKWAGQNMECPHFYLWRGKSCITVKLHTWHMMMFGVAKKESNLISQKR